MAGIYLLLQNPTAAVEEYRKVLQLADRFNKGKEEVTVDTLQLIHTMYNLAEVLVTAPPSSHALRDDSLREDCRKLEEKYIQKYITQVRESDFCKFFTSSLNVSFYIVCLPLKINVRM